MVSGWLWCTPTATKDVHNSWHGARTVGPRHARAWGHSTRVSHCAPLVALGLPQLLLLAPTQSWHRLNLVATSHSWGFSSQAGSWWPGDPTGSCPSRVGPQTPSPHPQPLVNVRGGLMGLWSHPKCPDLGGPGVSHGPDDKTMLEHWPGTGCLIAAAGWVVWGYYSSILYRDRFIRMDG